MMISGGFSLSRLQSKGGQEERKERRRRNEGEEEENGGRRGLARLLLRERVSQVFSPLHKFIVKVLGHSCPARGILRIVLVEPQGPMDRDRSFDAAAARKRRVRREREGEQPGSI